MLGAIFINMQKYWWWHIFCLPNWENGNTLHIHQRIRIMMLLYKRHQQRTTQYKSSVNGFLLRYWNQLNSGWVLLFECIPIDIMIDLWWCCAAAIWATYTHKIDEKSHYVHKILIDTSNLYGFDFYILLTTV